ncbi:Transmembrane protein 41B, partial [Podila verticillata]
MIEPIKHATHITSYGATPPPPPTAVAVVPSSYDVHDHDTTDEDDDDEIEALDAAKGATSTWRSWYRSLLKFFRGLGKFFLILAVGTVVLVLVLQYTLPSVDEEQRKDLHFPHSLEDLEALRKILSVYMDKHYYRVMVGFLTVYLYLQTFSVPGSMWLSILGGALFKFWIALTMVSL